MENIYFCLIGRSRFHHFFVLLSLVFLISTPIVELGAISKCLKNIELIVRKNLVLSLLI